MLYRTDLRYIKKYGTVAGIDEAGRGPLAGPVVAAAVILDPVRKIEGIKDSKKLSEEKRGKLYEEISTSAIAWSVAVVERDVIDEINILQASLLAMTKAARMLEVVPEFYLIDGNKAPFCLLGKSECLVRGDARSAAIAAASIIAKVTRDRIMMELHQKYPQYNFKQNKGYPTGEHLQAIRKYGITACHRLSYAPVRQMTLDL